MKNPISRLTATTLIGAIIGATLIAGCGNEDGGDGAVVDGNTVPADPASANTADGKPVPTWRPGMPKPK